MQLETCQGPTSKTDGLGDSEHCIELPNHPQLGAAPCDNLWFYHSFLLRCDDFDLKYHTISEIFV